MDSWLEFWNSANSLWVNDDHRAAHYDTLFEGLRPFLPANGVVLDWGCGESLAAHRIAQSCGKLLLFDLAENIRTRLRQRYDSQGKISILDPPAFDALP